jgi:hypothetical protein
MNCGTYNIKTGRMIKKTLKFILGKRANIRLMGRGDRQSAAELAKIAEPNRYPDYSANVHFRCTLPLKYAKKVAVYLTISKKRIEEKKELFVEEHTGKSKKIGLTDMN